MAPNDSEDSGTFGSVKTLIVDTRANADVRSRGVLVIVGGLESGRVYPISLGHEVILGRSGGATLRFDDVSVSGNHAKVACVADAFIFLDSGSTNGSFVNDVRVTKPVRLADGDRLQLGSGTFLRFSLVSADEERALITMHEAALRDGLTGTFNRKHLEERLDAEIAFALRHKTELSIVILDVDHFKKVNDTHGHPGGDAVLKHVAALLQRGIRTEDVLARYGGEEFVVVARGIAVGAATVLADRLRSATAQSPTSFDGKSIGVTISAGVASLVCTEGKNDKASLVAKADERLYKAKSLGRNRVYGAS